MKKVLLSTAVFGLFLATCWFSACQKDVPSPLTPTTNLQITDRANADSKVFPPTAHPYGKSYTEWSTIWMKEFMKLTCDENPWLNPANSKMFYTSSPVCFMAGIGDLGGSANVTIPHGKAILFPLINWMNDSPCPDANFHPSPGQSMEDFLTNGNDDFLGVVDMMAGVSEQSVTVDGADVSNPEKYLFTTDLFTFRGSPDLATCFDPCVTGEDQDGVASGNYIMLKPLSIGTHTVHYHMHCVIPAWGVDWVQDGTYHITVE